MLKKVILLLISGLFLFACATEAKYKWEEEKHDIKGSSNTAIKIDENEKVSFSVSNNVLIHLRGVLARQYSNDKEIYTKIYKIEAVSPYINEFKVYDVTEKNNEILNATGILLTPGSYQILYISKNVKNNFKIYLDADYVDTDSDGINDNLDDIIETDRERL